MQRLWRYWRNSKSNAYKVVATIVLGAVLIFLMPPEMDFSRTIAPASIADEKLRSISDKVRSLRTAHRFSKPVPHSVCPDDSSAPYTPQFDIFPRIPSITSRPNLQKAICEQERRQREAAKLKSFMPDADDDTKFLVRLFVFLCRFLVIFLFHCSAGVHVLGQRHRQPVPQPGLVLVPRHALAPRHDPRLA